MVAAQFEPCLPAAAGDEVGLRLLAVAAPLVQVDDVHASMVDYAECRPQGESVRKNEEAPPSEGAALHSTAPKCRLTESG